MTPSESKEWLWHTGFRIIMQHYGWTEQRARALMGKLDHVGGHQLAARAVMGIQRERPQEPYSWALKGIRKIQDKDAWKHRPGYRPPPVAPGEPISAEERKRGAERLAAFRAELEGM